MKIIQTISIWLLFTSMASACNNTVPNESSTESAIINNAESSDNSVSSTEETVSALGKTVTEHITAATKAGKAVFLVVFDKVGLEKDKALSIAKDASSKKPKTIEIIELNTSEAANSDLVATYRLAGAPLPLILVLDKNGITAGGLVLAEATSAALLDIIPSPRYSEILKAMKEQKSIFIVAYKESMADKTKAINNCNDAVKLMNNAAVVVQLNIDSKTETKLLDNLKVNTLSTVPIIYVINKSGQITGSFGTDAKVADLNLAATKVIKSSCCPGGGGSCGPK